jgi:hypothetical protein
VRTGGKGMWGVDGSWWRHLGAVVWVVCAGPRTRPSRGPPGECAPIAMEWAAPGVPEGWRSSKGQLGN